MLLAVVLLVLGPCVLLLQRHVAFAIIVVLASVAPVMNGYDVASLVSLIYFLRVGRRSARAILTDKFLFAYACLALFSLLSLIWTVNLEGGLATVRAMFRILLAMSVVGPSISTPRDMRWQRGTCP